jgi:[ribosomal protein S18]-alanine N-acetyltransferase
MPVTLRSATLADVPAILAIERQSATAAHWSADEYQRRVDTGFVLLGETAEGICGFVCARVVAGEWEIENVVVASELRRRGVGGELVRELLRQAEIAGGTAVWLEVRESNVAARGLYEKHGFRETGRRREYYKDPSEDAILYSFRFQPDAPSTR